MIKSIILVTIIFLSVSMMENTNAPRVEAHPYTIVIHGGAGTIKKENLTQEQETAYKALLSQALKMGKEHLEKGGTAIETVEIVIKILEDSPLFNAGKGSVFNNQGFQEMDASIMDGRDLSFGAVAGFTNLKNPIEGAKIVKDSTKHAFLYGERGQEFCLNKGATYADSTYFYSEYRWKQYQRALKKDIIELDHSEDTDQINEDLRDSKKFGTVGCVVLDKHGDLAAGTSTGGLTNKKFGRIGDSPIIGAGTYASNKSCAVSCTGNGEFFLKGTIARDIASLMEYKNYALEKSGREILKKLSNMKGKGGFISVDKQGKYIMMFNTRGMYRGVATSNGEFRVEMYK
ncbi:isoaspartyl peptidase/L-asparaginase family protein [Aquimarina sp. 2-A2]|uniref:isoaspartyl peptidase/L-asparaginase family protein n=1 Tax=Aquimarina sp. 2-A2 TaxID=3382644 RepID=UPI00387F2985